MLRLIKEFFFGDGISSIITAVGFIFCSVIFTAEFLSMHAKTLPLPQKTVWAQFDNNGTRSGINTQEHIITAATAPTLKRLWQISLPYKTNGAPVELPNVTTASGIKDVLFITTQRGSLVALDAQTGSKLWQKDTTGNFVGGQGTSSSPAIDPSGQFVYGYGLDGKVHKYAVGNGNEDSTKGFPVTVTLSTDVEKESAPITISNGYLYVTSSGYDGDFGQYVGHVVAVNLASGQTTVWNSLCSSVKQLSAAGFCNNKGSGIWERSGAVVDPVNNNVFVVTGNGNYNASSGGNNYGDSVIELTPDLSRIVDTYTPSSFGALDSNDDDLGSTGVAVIPTQTNTNTPHMAIIGSKDNHIRLINRGNLSGAGAPNHVGGELQTVPINCQTLSHPISWNDSSNTTWVFFTDMCSNLYGYKLVNNGTTSSLQQIYQKGNIGKDSPVIANGILYAALGNNLSAVDPASGTVLWSSSDTNAGGTIGAIHWQSPTTVNGIAYIADDNGNLTAYTPSQGTIAPTNTSTPSVTSKPTTQGGNISFAVGVCPHGLGKCGDNVNPNSGGNMNPRHPTRTVIIHINDASNIPVTSATGTLTFDSTNGNFSGTVNTASLNSGNYLITLHIDGYLDGRVPGIQTITAGTNFYTFPVVSLITGDIIHDNQLDIQDYNAIISCFGSKQQTSTCQFPPTASSSGADVNDDGKVDGIDYNLFLRELSVQKGGV